MSSKPMRRRQTKRQELRNVLQAELTALQKELKQKELALEAYQAVSHQADQHLQGQLKELQAQLITSQRLLEDRKTDLDASRFEAGALRERIVQLESAIQKAQTSTEIEVNRTQEALHTELAALKGQLEAKRIGVADASKFTQGS